MRARELMSTPVITVRPEATLKEVAEQMATHRVSGVPVVDEAGLLVGIVAESDILAKLEDGQKGRGLMGLLEAFTRALGADRKIQPHIAADLMTTQLITAGPEASVRELLHLMTHHHINRIPIVESGRVIGIITRADILRTMARPDRAITEDVRWRLLHDLWIDTTPLNVTTHSGIVTVSGVVGTRSEAELVKRWIGTIEGVVEVDARSLHYRIDDHHIDLPPGHVATRTGDLR